MPIILVIAVLFYFVAMIIQAIGLTGFWCLFFGSILGFGWFVLKYKPSPALQKKYEAMQAAKNNQEKSSADGSGMVSGFLNAVQKSDNAFAREQRNATHFVVTQQNIQQQNNSHGAGW